VYRAYSWQTSLFGFIFILFVMFYLQWIYALMTIVIILAIYLYIQCYFEGKHLWVDVVQALMFKMARGAMLGMENSADSFKYWRPSLLFITPRREFIETAGSLVPLISRLNDVKKSGLLVLGQPSTGDEITHALHYDIAVGEQWLLEHLRGIKDLKSFYQTALGTTGRHACLNLMLSAGLGKMTPDTVVLPLLESRGKLGYNLPMVDEKEYVGTCQDVLKLQKNLILSSNFKEFPSGGHQENVTIDMWVFGDLPPPETIHGIDYILSSEAVPLSLMLQLGQISFLKHLKKMSGFFGCQSGAEPCLRLIQVAGDASEELSDSAREERLEEWLTWARIPNASVKVVRVGPTTSAMFKTESVSSGEWSWVREAESREAINTLMRSESGQSEVTLMMMPPPEEERFVQQVTELIAGVPSTLMVANGQGCSVITTEI